MPDSDTRPPATVTPPEAQQIIHQRTGVKPHLKLVRHLGKLGEANGGFDSVQLHPKGTRYVYADSLEHYLGERTRVRVPSEHGALAIQPAQRRVDQRHVIPDRDYSRRLFNIAASSPLELVNMGTPARIAPDAVQAAFDGELWAVVLPEPGDDATPWWFNGQPMEGPALLCGRRAGEAEPNPRAPVWNMQRLYDVDEIAALIEFDAPEADADGNAAGSPAKGRKSKKGAS